MAKKKKRRICTECGAMRGRHHVCAKRPKKPGLFG